MREIVARIKFWLQVQGNRAPFWIKRRTGFHVSVKSYDIFSDTVSYREGRFGTCDFGKPYPQVSRKHYLALGDLGWERYQA